MRTLKYTDGKSIYKDTWLVRGGTATSLQGRPGFRVCTSSGLSMAWGGLSPIWYAEDGAGLERSWGKEISSRTIKSLMDPGLAFGF